MTEGIAFMSVVISTYTRDETIALCSPYLELPFGMLKETKRNGETILTTTPFSMDLSGLSNPSLPKMVQVSHLSRKTRRYLRTTKPRKLPKGFDAISIESTM